MIRRRRIEVQKLSFKDLKENVDFWKFMEKKIKEVTGVNIRFSKNTKNMIIAFYESRSFKEVSSKLQKNRIAIYMQHNYFAEKIYTLKQNNYKIDFPFDEYYMSRKTFSDRRGLVYEFIEQEVDNYIN